MNNLKSNIDYWIACSGGVDSVVLVRLFKELNKNFGILHCNFNLRGKDSEVDEEFVRGLAEEVDVPFKVKHFDIQKYINDEGGNTQLAARNLRYQWFEEINREYNSMVVLGHHKDDQVETFLLQLRRGGKLKGLSGMATFHNDYLRPLLNYSKEEIYALADKKNWAWREDSSNRRSMYFRNLYRNELLPSLEDRNDIETQILELVSNFQKLLGFSEHYLNFNYNFSNDIIVNFVQWDIWPYWLKHLFISKSGLAPLSVKEIERLRHTEKGKSLKSDFKTIWNDGGMFCIRNNEGSKSVPKYNVDLVEVKDVVFKNGVVFFDKDKVEGRISLRSWRAGEVFQPFGMKGKKKVSKFLRDRKLPSSDKENYPVIVDELDRIIGVFKMCPDERYKIDQCTLWAYRVQ